MKLLDDGIKLPIEATTTSPTSANMPRVSFEKVQPKLNERVTLYPLYFVTSMQISSGQPMVGFEGKAPTVVYEPLPPGMIVLFGGDSGESV